ncbi:MAG: hypothetical protein AB7G17_01190 [Phycisphaerales bacterium]
MLKFLRRYNKIILVIGGVVLMVAFLVPQALQQLGQAQQHRTIAKIDGKPLSALQAARASQELGLAESALLGIDIQRLFEIEDGIHWVLLTREAEDAGFVGGPSSAQSVLDEMGTLIASFEGQRLQQAGQIVDMGSLERQVREALTAQHARLTAQNGARSVDDALAKLAGVLRLRMAYQSAARLSTASARGAADAFFNAVEIDGSGIPADSLVGEVGEPSAETLAAHFEKYRDVEPGSGDHGFGYRQPDAVKLEWLSIDREYVRQAVRPDPIEMRKRWQMNRDRFPGEYETEKSRVEELMRAEATQTAMTEGDQVVKAEIVQQARRFAGDGAWQNVPAGWREEVKPLERIAKDVADRLESRVGARIEPRVAQRETWMTTQDLSALQGLGRGEIVIGARRARFDELLSAVRELQDGTLRGGFQVGVLYGPVVDGTGNAHYFRILEARRQGPPASIDVVRESVYRDVQRLMAFERLQARVPDLRASVLEKGLEETVKPYGSTVVKGFMNRRQTFGAGAGLDSQAVRDAVMDKAGTLDPTKPLEEQDKEKRFVVEAAPKLLAVALVEIKGMQPMTSDDLAAQYMLYMQQVQAALSAQAGDSPFTLERMKQRHGYVEVGEKRGERAEASTAG